jgi:ribosomal protein S18 acetylase RimI-like enzyme
MQFVITTWYLEMTTREELRPKRSTRGDLLLARVERAMPELNRFFYTAVGGNWYWVDRLPWPWSSWLEYLSRAELETWVLSVAGVPAGYFELEQQPQGNLEIVYFGLLPSFTGMGLGGHLLTLAVERAWELASRRVWLHTCSLDHPAALAHYQARGFRIYRQEVHSEELPPQSPGAWPGAGQPCHRSE